MGSAWRVPRSVGACLVWLASALPFLVEPFLAEGRLAGISRAALAALPWIAWAGLPRSGASSTHASAAKLESAKPRPAQVTFAKSTLAQASSAKATSEETGPLDGAIFDAALCLPPIALGSWIDLANGIARADAACVAAGSAVLVLLLSLAARLAARSSAAFRRHALVWSVFVVGLPLLRGALELGGAPSFGVMPAWIAWLARASPLAWIIARLDASSATVGAAFGAFLAALVLLSIGTGFVRSSAGKEAAA
jgi:hypothetical protein